MPVEAILERLVVPLAHQAPVLLLVADGLSYSIFRELCEDLDALGWDPVDAQTLLERLQNDRHGARGPVTAAPELLERLVALELSGAVERLSDGRFKRLFK